MATVSLDNVISRVLQLEKTRPPGTGNSFFLNLRGHLNRRIPWANIGHVLITQQFPIVFDFPPEIMAMEAVPTIPKLPVSRSSSMTTMSVETTDKLVTIYTTQNSGPTTRPIPLASIDKTTGALQSYYSVMDGRNWLAHPLTPNFTRAATENDKRGRGQPHDSPMFPLLADLVEWTQLKLGSSGLSHAHHWSSVGLSQDCPPKLKCFNLTVQKEGDKDDNHKDRNDHCGIGGPHVVVHAQCQVCHNFRPVVLFTVDITYTVYGTSGQVHLSQRVRPQDPALERLVSMPRIGLYTELRPAIADCSSSSSSSWSNNRLWYYGRGPHENYPDRQASTEWGVFETTPFDMGHDQYIVPGENGCRSDCEWIAFGVPPSGSSNETTHCDDARNNNKTNNKVDGLLIVSTSSSRSSLQPGNAPCNKPSVFHCSALVHSAVDLETAHTHADLQTLTATSLKNTATDPPTTTTTGSSVVCLLLDDQLMGVGQAIRVGNGSSEYCSYVDPDCRVSFSSAAAAVYEYSIALCPLVAPSSHPDDRWLDPFTVSYVARAVATHHHCPKLLQQRRLGTNRRSGS